MNNFFTRKIRPYFYRWFGYVHQIRSEVVINRRDTRHAIVRAILVPDREYTNDLKIRLIRDLRPRDNRFSIKDERSVSESQLASDVDLLFDLLQTIESIHMFASYYSNYERIIISEDISLQWGSITNHILSHLYEGTPLDLTQFQPKDSLKF